MKTPLDTGLLTASDLNGGSYRPGVDFDALKPLYSPPIQHAIDSKGKWLFGVDHVVVETAEMMSREIFEYLHRLDGFHKPAQLYVDHREIMTNKTFLSAYGLAVSGRRLDPREEHLLTEIVGILAEELKPGFFREMERRTPTYTIRTFNVRIPPFLEWWFSNLNHENNNGILSMLKNHLLQLRVAFHQSIGNHRFPSVLRNVKHF